MVKLYVIKKEGKYLWYDEEYQLAVWTSLLYEATIYSARALLDHDLAHYGGVAIEVEIREVIPYKACPNCLQVVDTDEKPLQDYRFIYGYLNFICPHCSAQLGIHEIEITRAGNFYLEYKIELLDED